MSPKFVITLLSLQTLRDSYLRHDWHSFVSEPDFGLHQGSCESLYRYMVTEALTVSLRIMNYDMEVVSFHDSWRLVYKTNGLRYFDHCSQLLRHARIPVPGSHQGFEAKVMVLDDVAVIAYQTLA